MLTFDNQPRDERELPKPGIKVDLVEVGENNKVWFRVLRSKRELHIVDKETGKTKIVPVTPELVATGSTYGLGPRQLGAAFAALRL